VRRSRVSYLAVADRETMARPRLLVRRLRAAGAR